jgi:hypothetical protein
LAGQLGDLAQSFWSASPWLLRLFLRHAAHTVLASIPLLRGRGMAQLTALRPLLSEDAGIVSYISEALERDGLPRSPSSG